ncbi:MAG: Na+-transporting NADH:ubiquinone oxidoreductase subunit A [Patiriisocius sp.]|jgi:Na+-transporting NADH:ubiquinone oxidoreductase subunit A
MSKTIKIKKGKDIKLVGVPEKITTNAQYSDYHTIKPVDFTGLTPKMVLKEGAVVKAGTVLFYDKNNEKIKFVSPVSGTLEEIQRGAKRKILGVKIKADKEISYEKNAVIDPNSLSREELIDKMLEVGLWPMIRRRPFSTVADPFEMPRDIYISCLDSAPLAPSMGYLVKGNEAIFQAGLDALVKLTNGKVYLGVDDSDRDNPFTQFKGVEFLNISGPHPAGNVGVQVHHHKPINQGEAIWYTYAQEILTIGKYFISGQYDATRVIALTGSGVTSPKYYKTVLGAKISSITDGQLKDGNYRVISGNVLTGQKVNTDESVGFFDNQITVIPEGDQLKFFLTDGWLSPGLKKFSMSRSYPSWLMPNKTYDLDTNLNGEIRGFVMTGELEKVFPFDIYPMQLVKSIMANDIEAMEQLGIYEVDSEDFALPEVVCTSKINIQEIVKNGLEDLRKELM